jgi:hypothetical protein
MIYCLNSKKPHENREPLTSSPGSPNVALPGASTGILPVAVEEHVKGNAITISAAIGSCPITGTGTIDTSATQITQLTNSEEVQQWTFTPFTGDIAVARQQELSTLQAQLATRTEYANCGLNL